jgi:hypothetical protein
LNSPRAELGYTGVARLGIARHEIRLKFEKSLWRSKFMFLADNFSHLSFFPPPLLGRRISAVMECKLLVVIARNEAIQIN